MMKGRETFYGDHPVPITNCIEVQYVLLKGLRFTVEKISPRAGFKLGPLEISRPALKPLSYWGSKHKPCYYKTFTSIIVNWFYFAKSQSISAERKMLVGWSFSLSAL